jgi:hypothetical protein
MEDMVVVQVDDMEEVPTEEMVVVTTTLYLHELYNLSVVVSFCVKYDKDLQNYVACWYFECCMPNMGGYLILLFYGFSSRRGVDQ